MDQTTLSDRMIWLLEVPSSLWRHRKHDPLAGRYHDYEVLLVSEAAPQGDGRGMPDVTHQYAVLHSETLETWHVFRDGCDLHWLLHLDRHGWATEPLVVYRNIRYTDAKPWTRPASHFLDGRFQPLRSACGKVTPL